VLKLTTYTREMVFAFGLTGALMLVDFWATLFFVLIPQLYGARCILRINLIQHDGCDTTSDYNHSCNFVGRLFNWVMCNNGYHTIHHNRPGVHWSELAREHEREVVSRIDPKLDEPSMLAYLLRTFVLHRRRPASSVDARGPHGPNAAASSLASRTDRRREVEAELGVTR
jgi:beta-carotene hydroxylase